MPFGYRDDAEHRSPGWYADTQRPGQERWWNGVAWSESRRPAGGGPVTSVSGPSAEAIPMAATPRDTMSGLAGTAAPRPVRTAGGGVTGAGAGARAGDSVSAGVVVAFLIGIVGLVAGLAGFLWIPLIALGLALSARRGALRTGRSPGAASGAVALAIAGCLAYLVVMVVPAIRIQLAALLQGLTG
jgi:hypothetical protein